MTDSIKKRSLPYGFFTSIPVFGTTIKILNSYAYRGDFRAGYEFAGFFAYVNALWRPLIASIVLSSITLYPWVIALLCNGAPFSVKLGNFVSLPGVISVSIFPSVLGFGIGVYALVFAIPERLVRDFDKIIKNAIEKGRRKRGSVLVLNADLGYPLVVMAIALAVGVLQQALPEINWLIVACWFTFWYAMVSVVEIIGVLFQIGDLSVLEKSSAGESDNKAK